MRDSTTSGDAGVTSSVVVGSGKPQRDDEGSGPVLLVLLVLAPASEVSGGEEVPAVTEPEALELALSELVPPAAGLPATPGFVPTWYVPEHAIAASAAPTAKIVQPCDFIDASPFVTVALWRHEGGVTLHGDPPFFSSPQAQRSAERREQLDAR
jgi:hypothetical protein